MSNSFKDEIKDLANVSDKNFPPPSYDSQISEEELREIFNKVFTIPFNTTEAKEYFRFLIASFMLEYDKCVGSKYNLKSEARFKSPDSIDKKVKDYLSRKDKFEAYFSQTRGRNEYSMDVIKDPWAMRLVLGNKEITPEIRELTHNNEKMKQLIDELESNIDFVSDINRFKSKFIQYDENGNEYKITTNVTRRDFYSKYLDLINRFLAFTPEKATKLKQHLEMLRKRVITVYSTAKLAYGMTGIDELITEKDLYSNSQTPKEIPFVKLLDSFESQIYDKVNLELLTRTNA